MLHGSHRTQLRAVFAKSVREEHYMYVIGNESPVRSVEIENSQSAVQAKKLHFPQCDLNTSLTGLNFADTCNHAYYTLCQLCGFKFHT